MNNAWTKITKEKPPKSGEYLIVTNTNYIEKLWYNQKENQWIDECDEQSDGYWERMVTHWMELPDLPKDEIE